MKKQFILTIVILLAITICSRFSYAQFNTNALLKDSIINLKNKTYENEKKELELITMIKELKSSIAVYYNNGYYYDQAAEELLKEKINSITKLKIINDKTTIEKLIKSDKIRYIIQLYDSKVEQIKYCPKHCCQ